MVASHMGNDKKVIGSELMRLRCGATDVNQEVSWREKKSNIRVLEVGVELTLRGSINGRKLHYFGHINRRDADESVEKVILQGAVEGSRGKGRPITSLD